MSVYFAQAGGYVKIGYSANPIARSSTLTLSGRRPADVPRGAEVTLLGWVPGDRDVEAGWHRHFAVDHVYGEWFYIDPAAAREVIWADPHGVDIRRMSAMAVFTAVKYPELSRDQMSHIGIQVLAKPLVWRRSA